MNHPPSHRPVMMNKESPPESEGWVRRYIAHTSRIDEAVELYSQLGYEVRVEAVTLTDFDAGCGDCSSLAVCQFKVIYTRKKVAGDNALAADAI